jgi:hypothetical protein
MTPLTKGLQLTLEKHRVAFVRVHMVCHGSSQVEAIGLAHHAERMDCEENGTPFTPASAVKMLVVLTGHNRHFPNTSHHPRMVKSRTPAKMAQSAKAGSG